MGLTIPEKRLGREGRSSISEERRSQAKGWFSTAERRKVRRQLTKCMNPLNKKNRTGRSRRSLSVSQFYLSVLTVELREVIPESLTYRIVIPMQGAIQCT